MKRFMDVDAEEPELETEQETDLFERFRQSRLYVQVILAGILVGAALLVYALPIERPRTALQWVVTDETDWRGVWERLDQWAADRGGWSDAVRSVWDRAVKAVEPVLGDQTSQLDAKGSAPPAKAAGGGTTPSEDGAPSKAGGKGAAAPDVVPSDTDAKGAAGKKAPSPIEVEPGDDKVLPVESAVIFGYQWRTGPDGKDELHEAIDLLAEPGAPVLAIRAGQVTRVVHRDPTWGGLVEIQHGDHAAVYACLEAIRVQAGEQVKPGQQLAVIAALPVAEQQIGSHLHLEITPKQTGMPIDPAHYLSVQGTGT